MKNETILELKNAMAHGAISLIDVRESDEYELGHVPGAINLPLSTLAQEYKQLDPNQTHHIICLSGGRSIQAVQFLGQHGLDVINILGGTKAWPDALER